MNKDYLRSLRQHTHGAQFVQWFYVPTKHKGAVETAGGVTFTSWQLVNEAADLLNSNRALVDARDNRTNPYVHVLYVGWVYVPTEYEIGLILREKLVEAIL